MSCIPIFVLSSDQDFTCTRKNNLKNGIIQRKCIYTLQIQKWCQKYHSFSLTPIKLIYFCFLLNCKLKKGRESVTCKYSFFLLPEQSKNRSGKWSMTKTTIYHLCTLASGSDFNRLLKKFNGVVTFLSHIKLAMAFIIQIFFTINKYDVLRS